MSIGRLQAAGNRMAAAREDFSFRSVRVFSMTSGSSLQGANFTAPRIHVSCLLNTRFKRCAEAIEARHSIGVLGSSMSEHSAE
jgi:hypothetical protein